MPGALPSHLAPSADAVLIDLPDVSSPVMVPNPLVEPGHLPSSPAEDGPSRCVEAEHPHDSDIDDGENESQDEDGPLLEVNPEAAKPRKITHRKRANIAVFDAFLEQNKEELCRPSEPQHPSKNGVSGLSGSPGQRVIEGAREYQLELFERAKQKNIIAVLDTGTGKTLISILLIRHIIEKEFAARSEGKDRRIAFFLVDKVALVWQQTKHLEANLDHPVEGIHGDAATHMWKSRDFWTGLFEKNRVIVCTAEILYKCLHHSYITMAQINLLVFDEAHHAKKSHPYAKIIEDFYAPEQDPEKRPRVFGMTASPIDVKTNKVERAATVLELLLRSEIATIAEPDLFKTFGGRPAERNVHYGPLGLREPTELWWKLDSLIGRHPQFRQAFNTARFFTTELGSWCADRVWELILRQDGHNSARLEAKTESELAKEAFGWRNDTAECLEELRAATKIVKSWSFEAPTDDDQLSDKVEKLLQILGESFNDPLRSSQCIVFVERRHTATMLVDLVNQPSVHEMFPTLKAAALMGSGRGDLGHESISIRRQQSTLDQFRSGELNCLFATSVAEEGLDIPGCNVVVRFDPSDTTIQYIQSRGRARMVNSTFVHMLEMGNMDHLRKRQQNLVNEQKMRAFCQSLPEDRLIQKDDVDLDVLLRQDKSKRVFVVDSTGAKLTYKQSISILAEFVNSLHSSSQALPPLVEYTIVPHPKGGFQAEVLLPASSPLRAATGRPHRTKQLAKFAAAYEMCRLLYQGRYLDEHLKPIFTKNLPAMRNARLAISSKKKAEYSMRLKPDMWADVGLPERLFATALVLSNPQAMRDPSRPILMLTRQSLPQIAPFTLFFGEGRSSNVLCMPVSGSFQPSGNQLEGMSAFTLRIFRDVFSKDFEATGENLPYFMVPTVKDHDWFPQLAQQGGAGDTINTLVDWQSVERVEKADKMPFTFGEPDDFFQNKYVTDPFDGSRKFFLRRVRRDLTPQDPSAEGSPGLPRQWKKMADTIMNYSAGVLWTKSRERRLPKLRENQPVVEADFIPLRRNLLDETDSSVALQPKTCFLILETLEISLLPSDIVAMAYNIPAIIYRLESYLIALDACKLCSLDIRPDLAVMALTKDSANSGEHDEQPINFQQGMGENYERLEFLGDTFLKMATTIALYAQLPDKGEYESHVDRMVMICNKNLFNNALLKKLQEYVRSKSFSRRTWYPPGLVLKKGKQLETEGRHSLGDKSIADVCEALIGAAYLTTRKPVPDKMTKPTAPNGNGVEEPQPRKQQDMDMAIKAVTAMVKNKMHRMQTWGDYLAAYIQPQWIHSPPTPLQAELARQIHEKMGYEFRSPRLLRSAFMHPSYPHLYEHLPSYQRLEFLGDALLDMACVDHIFHRFPKADPQSLTERKTTMVSNQFYGCLAVELGFHRHLLILNTQHASQVSEWLNKINGARAEAEEEAVSQGKSKSEFSRDFWQRVEDPPKCLADAVESYVGAVFVDSGFDYSTVEHFFAKFILPWFPISPRSASSGEGEDEDSKNVSNDYYNGRSNNGHNNHSQNRVDDDILYHAMSKNPIVEFGKLMTDRFGCSHHAFMIREIPDLDGDAAVTSLVNATKVLAVCIVHEKVRAHAVAASGRYAKLAVAKKARAMYRDVVDRAAFRELVPQCDCQTDEEAFAAAKAAADAAEAAERREEEDEEFILAPPRPPSPPRVSLDGMNMRVSAYAPRYNPDSRLRMHERMGATQELPW